MEKLSGIYKIQQNGGKCYIGSASNVRLRWNQHLTALHKGTHHSVKLQRAWDKYGEASFSFDVVEFVEDRALLIQREQYWIDALSAYANGYNVAPKAGSNLGVKHRESANAEKSLRMIGRVVPIETREKLRIANIGLKKSPEVVAAQSARMKGKQLSEFNQARAKEANTGRKMAADLKENLAIANTGRAMPSHVRDALQAAVVGRKQSPEEIKKRSEKLRGKKRPQAAIDATAASRRGIKLSDDQKRKISESLKGRVRPRELVEKTAAANRGKKREPHVIQAMQEGRRLQRERLIEQRAER